MSKRKLSVNSKGTVTIECDNCGKQNFVKLKNIDDEVILDLIHNSGIFCSKCDHHNHSKEPRMAYLFGELFIVYADVISIEHLQGSKKAKEILKSIEN